MQNIELKPCPFCGSSEAYVTNPKVGDYFPIGLNEVALLASKKVVCFECGMGVVFGFAKKSPNLISDEEAEMMQKETAEAWNRRADNE